MLDQGKATSKKDQCERSDRVGEEGCGRFFQEQIGELNGGTKDSSQGAERQTLWPGMKDRWDKRKTGEGEKDPKSPPNESSKLSQRVFDNPPLNRSHAPQESFLGPSRQNSSPTI